MPPIVKRRTGKGYEREIHSLTRLRSAIVMDDRIETVVHARILNEIDALITSLSGLIRSGFNLPTVRTGTD